MKLTVTQPGNASYRNETVTDAKGSYAVTLLDATPPPSTVADAFDEELGRVDARCP